MKKRIIFITCIISYLVLITSVCFFINNNNFESTIDVKQHFCDDFNKKYDKQYADSNSFILVGEYKKGYLLVEYLFNVHDYDDISHNTDEIEIDDIVISTFRQSKFYFYRNGKITCGLEEIYNKKLISKDELVDIKNYIESFKKNKYMVKDYIIE